MKQTKKIVCKLTVNSKKLPIDKKRQISTKRNSIINLVRNMSIFESLIVNLIFLLFPFLIYEIYIIYSNNEKEQKLFFDLAIFSSMFLIIRYSSQKNTIANLVFINFPLLIAFLKKRTILVIILSIITIYYYHLILKTPIIYGIIEYSLYLIIYIYLQKKKSTGHSLLNIFISLKSFLIACILFLRDIDNTKSVTTITYLVLIILIFMMTMTSILCLIKEGEKILEKNKSLKELEKEKELKLALFKLTHEIKNPIAVCKGYLEMLNPKKKDKVEKYLPIIEDEINRTLTIINDFSDYGKLKIEKEEIDLVMLMEDIEETLMPLLKEKNVCWTFATKEEEVYIELDYNRIKQVLINLIKNSIEAAQEKKPLKIKMTLKKLKDEVQIKVEDTGIGMSKEVLDKISKIFYTTKENGTGLGVALSKEIIDQHQGTMYYQSEVGKGTKVTIFLPIKEKG